MSVVRIPIGSPEPLTAEEEARFRALAEREPNFGPAAMSWIPGLLATIDAVRAALVRTPETLELGTTTDCPLEGVHEHTFRGPHRFHEWDPSSYFTLNDRPPVRTPETLDAAIDAMAEALNNLDLALEHEHPEGHTCALCQVVASLPVRWLAVVDAYRPTDVYATAMLGAWRKTKDFLRDRLLTSGRSDVNIHAILRVMNEALNDLAASPAPDPGAEE